MLFKINRGKTGLQVLWKRFLLVIFNLSVFTSIAQLSDFSLLDLSLPKELAYHDNQFSGLYIHEEKLFLLSESRLQDNAEPKLYSIRLNDLDHKLRDTSFTLPFKKLHIHFLDAIKNKVNATAKNYDGLEAMLIDGSVIYFSLETTTDFGYCYLLRGLLNDTSVLMDRDFLLPLAKPPKADGSFIYNAGFESLVKIGKNFLAFYEFNSFANNYALQFGSGSERQVVEKIAFNKLPFRLTDVTQTNENHFTGINYFYKGGGADAVYRPAENDLTNNKLVQNDAGYRSYCRLVDLESSSKGFTWKTLWEFPAAFMNYNWEGIAAYKKGYFIVNDKYTPVRPYQTHLVYLERRN